MRELDRRIATLRLRMAEIDSRQDQLKALQRQFKGQLDRVMDFAVYEKGELDSALSMAQEVDVRLSETERTLRHLATIRARCQEELQALLLTRSIEAAKVDLAELEARRRELEDQTRRLEDTGSSGPGAQAETTQELARLAARLSEVRADIRLLRHTISEASEEAARAVSARAARVRSEA